MSFYSGSCTLPRRFRLILSSFMQHDSLAFAEVLSEETIAKAFADADADFAQDEDDVYTPALTLWAFLSQVLAKDHLRSCKAAVARVVVLLVALGKAPCSDNTGAYCRARSKLSAPVIRELTCDVASGCEQRLPRSWLWKGRHVDLVDGSTLSMTDTKENQEAYPQATTQKKGLGFPTARVVVLISLATGMVKDLAIGPYAGKETGETALLRELLEKLVPGSILLGDRYYCTYFMLALLQELHIDFVVRLHQCREADFSRGKRLGAGDHVVVWNKPVKPAWMDEDTYEKMPATLEIREVYVQVHQAGFRTDSLVVVTNLTDACAYTQEDIAELYHRRWLVELDIRAIKVTLGMDILRCTWPEMVQREIWTCLLACNLIRQTMLEAALKSDVSPRQLSFTAALQKIATSWALLSTCDASSLVTLIDVHLEDMIFNQIGKRPNRVEPRAIKRRPKPQKLLTEPRKVAQAKLLNGAAK